MIGASMALRAPFTRGLANMAMNAIRRAGGTVLLAGLARNYFDSAGTTAATVDNPVGLVQDSVGSNHATQATTGSKPTLRRGLVNQLLWSGDFTNAAWAKTNTTVTANAAADHEGAVTADKLVATATSGVHAVQQTLTLSAGVHSYVVRAKAGEYGWLAISMDGSAFAYYDLSTGAVGTVGAGHTASISTAGNGYYDCIATFTFTAGAKTIFHNIASANNTVSFAGNGTNGIFVESAAIYQGTVTAQQILAAGGIPLTTTAPASSALGNYWWQFDPSAPGDFFNTGISTGNEGWVCAGVTPANTTTAMSVVNSGEGTATIPGVWLYASGAGTWLAGSSNGTVRTLAGRAMIGAVPQVVSMGWDASSVSVGVDGVEASAARTGSCASGANVLRIGMYQGASIPFSGSMSVTIICPTLPPPADRALIRAWVAKQQGQTL